MTKWNWIAIGFCCVAVLGMWLGTPAIINCLGFTEISAKGQFGDQFGFYNAMASSLTIILLAVATIYQHRQYETQQKEYQDSQAAEKIRVEQDLERIKLQTKIFQEQAQANKIALLQLRVKNEREFLTHHQAGEKKDENEIQKAKKNIDKFEDMIKKEFNDAFPE